MIGRATAATGICRGLSSHVGLLLWLMEQPVSTPQAPIANHRHLRIDSKPMKPNSRPDRTNRNRKTPVVAIIATLLQLVQG